eukprot:1156449-Pelagomonas_calceolata.AAC.5
MFSSLSLTVAACAGEDHDPEAQRQRPQRYYLGRTVSLRPHQHLDGRGWRVQCGPTQGPRGAWRCCAVLAHIVAPCDLHSPGLCCAVRLLCKMYLQRCARYYISLQGA